MSAHGVEFEENSEFDPIPEPELQPDTFGDVFVRTKVVSTQSGAAMLMAVFAFLLFVASAYILASALPQQPTLGKDVLSPGEVVPNYEK